MDADGGAGLDVMSEFMDIVTTFKCKGCEFICHKQEELMEHVKSEHMAKTTGTSTDSSSGVKLNCTTREQVDESSYSGNVQSTTYQTSSTSVKISSHLISNFRLMLAERQSTLRPAPCWPI